MKYRVYSYRYGHELMLHDDDLNTMWQDIDEVISSISDQDIIDEFSNYPNNKSISRALNSLLKDGFINNNWDSESPIFQPHTGYTENIWRLDFAKSRVSLEVAFNHGGTAAWNLLKPTIASELNHVEKAIQTDVGVVITSTGQLKSEGGFDGAIAEYEKYITYMKALRNQLTVPMVIIGLEPLDSFYIEVAKNSAGKNIGTVKLK